MFWSDYNFKELFGNFTSQFKGTYCIFANGICQTICPYNLLTIAGTKDYTLH